MIYFAYNEKMFLPELHRIVPSAMYIGVAKILGYKLFFHNRGVFDPSGKGNIVPVKEVACEVYGVLYEIPLADRYLLDRSEGLGSQNQEIKLKVFTVDLETPEKTKEQIAAFTYVAHKDNIFEDLVPFSWYKEKLILGARQHKLPMEYIHHLEQYPAISDPNAHRAQKQNRYLDPLLL